MVSCGSTGGAVESSYLCIVRLAKVVRRFPPALQLFKKLNNEAASKDNRATGMDLGTTHPEKAVLSSVNDYDVPLYIKAAAAQTTLEAECGFQ